MEDINNILNSGEIPNLFNRDDIETITDTIRPAAQNLGISLTKNSYAITKFGIPSPPLIIAKNLSLKTYH